MIRDEASALTADDDERVKALLAFTDTALSKLSVSELLDEMLERIRVILEVDTVTLLRMDASGENLVATAAVGMEEEIRQGVMVLVGTGFAGTIAARRTAMTVNEVGPETVANPILWEKGLRTIAGAPLLRDEAVIGVVHVARLDPIPFTDVDLQLLSVAAERLVGAVTSVDLANERAAAQVLERSLLPSRFPTVPGAEFAGRYAAADRLIGGDWYDVFTLPGGALWLVAGDVAGHGLGSAVVMGRIRSALRAYALLGGSPDEVLELTDRKVHHFELGAMTTVLCAVAEPPYQEFVISSAGHLAPLLAIPGADTMTVDVDTNPPLGSFPGVKRTTTTVQVPLGGVLVLFTDGLVERPGEPIDDGVRRLRGVTSAEHPAIVCRTAMLRMVGSSTTDDDIAVLAMRRTAM